MSTAARCRRQCCQRGTAAIENGGTLEFGGPSNVSITFEAGSASSSAFVITTVDDPLVNAGTIPSGTNDGGFGTVLTDINDAGQVVGVYYAGVAVYSGFTRSFIDETFTASRSRYRWFVRRHLKYK